MNQKIKDNITKSLNGISRNLGFNPINNDDMLSFEICKFLRTQYLDMFLIREYNVIVKYPNVNVYIRFNNCEIDRIDINRFDRISKLIKLKEIEIEYV